MSFYFVFKILQNEMITQTLIQISHPKKISKKKLVLCRYLIYWNQCFLLYIPGPQVINIRFVVLRFML